jgi:hypothetical protein
VATTEYYTINVPISDSVPEEVKGAFTELLEQLLRISERLNDFEERIEDLE